MENEQVLRDGRIVTRPEGAGMGDGRGSVEEEEVSILEEPEESQTEARLFCVFRNVLGLKHVNPQAFANVMKIVWNPLKGIEVEQNNRNLFLFKLFSKRDRHMIVEADKPWFFEKQLVVMKAISGDEVLTQVPLHEVLLWVQMLDIH
ncbi:hypothetical protein Tsubulata_011682 [Turnera subulata]|uniref:DUF4283 domain-containing protein n=1 Tax=Turnera subulata TaxID=218843 RepID=A0A9Q0G7S7_9ROSI|nr:hypothetical protein Tsubulata_011682 [Turnera subulata]